jgi:hypothetical protein
LRRRVTAPACGLVAKILPPAESEADAAAAGQLHPSRSRLFHLAIFMLEYDGQLMLLPEEKCGTKRIRLRLPDRRAFLHSVGIRTYVSWSPNMAPLIGYYRLSTQKQGRSGCFARRWILALAGLNSGTEPPPAMDVLEPRLRSRSHRSRLAGAIGKDST